MESSGIIQGALQTRNCDLKAQVVQSLGLPLILASCPFFPVLPHHGIPVEQLGKIHKLNKSINLKLKKVSIIVQEKTESRPIKVRQHNNSRLNTTPPLPQTIKNLLFTILLHSYRESALVAQFDKGTTRKQ